MNYILQQEGHGQCTSHSPLHLIKCQLQKICPETYQEVQMQDPGGARPTYEVHQELWDTLQNSRIVGQAGNPHPWSANQVQGGPRSDYGQKRAKVITLHPFLPRQGHLGHLPAAATAVMSMFILSASEKCH